MIVKMNGDNKNVMHIFSYTVISPYFVKHCEESSEWLLFNANSAIFQLSDGVNFKWDDDEVRLY